MTDIDLRSLFDTAMRAADPLPATARYLPPLPKGRIVVAGAGKASARMAEAVEERYPECSGVIAVPHGSHSSCQKIETVFAAHPVPDATSEAAARRLLEAVGGLTEDDLVIALISGGGSALAAAPAPGISLSDKQRVTEDLLASGATINEINTVRRALSAIKGGGLARAAHPARVLTLIVSDVPGDDPGAVASGPTIPSSTNAADAAAILARCEISPPRAVGNLLTTRMIGNRPHPGIPVEAHIVLRGRDMLEAAERKAKETGFPVLNLGDAVEGRALDVARAHAARLLEIPPGTLLLSGGELSVGLGETTAAGRGGRNTEYALALALALEGKGALHAIACDTDGIDGSSDAAGAIVTPDSLAAMRQAGIDPAEKLRNHDSAEAFAAAGRLISTGPTGTNLNDFRCAHFRAGSGAPVRL